MKKWQDAKVSWACLKREGEKRNLLVKTWGQDLEVLSVQGFLYFVPSTYDANGGEGIDQHPQQQFGAATAGQGVVFLVIRLDGL